MGKTEAQIPMQKVAVGNIIKIKGEVIDKAKRFTIDLYDVTQGEILLSFTVDFKNKEISRNAQLEKDAGWGSKEAGGDFVFQSPMKFEMTIVVEAPFYNITINDQPYCTFRHRAPYNKVNALRIQGDIIIEQIDVEGAFYRCMKPGGELIKFQPSNDAGPSSLTVASTADTTATANVTHQPSSTNISSTIRRASSTEAPKVQTKQVPQVPAHKAKSQTSLYTQSTTSIQDPPKLNPPSMMAIQESGSRRRRSESRDNGQLRRISYVQSNAERTQRSNQNTGCCSIT